MDRPPGRRSWKLARETVTLDHLSAVRLILGIGLGTNFYREYADFGEPTDDRVHAAMLDEGLAILACIRALPSSPPDSSS